jgi:hypothetical protein
MPQASKRLAECASEACSSKDRVLLLMLADMMAEEGDIRHNAVRNHAGCCARGWGIATNLAFEHKIYTELPPFLSHPDTWTHLEERF